MVVFLVIVKKEENNLDSKTNLIIEKTLLKIKVKGIIRKQEIQDIEIMQQKLNQNILLVSFLSISSSADSFDSWLVNSGASKHFTHYKEALSNIVERETNLNVILGDNSTHQVKGYCSISFQLDDYKSIFL